MIERVEVRGVDLDLDAVQPRGVEQGGRGIRPRVVVASAGRIEITAAGDEEEHRDICAGDEPHQADADDGHAHDGARLERDVERAAEARLGSLRGAHGGARRAVHAEVAGRGRSRAAEQERHAGLPAQELALPVVRAEAERDEHHGQEDREPAVLGVQERAAAFLHSIKSINVDKVRPEAIDAKWTEEILKQRGLKAPIGQVKALPASQAPKG